MLSKSDLEAIRMLLKEELKPVYDFIDFAKPAIISLLEESQERHEQNLPERVKNLEEALKNN